MTEIGESRSTNEVTAVDTSTESPTREGSSNASSPPSDHAPMVTESDRQSPSIAQKATEIAGCLKKEVGQVVSSTYEQIDQGVSKVVLMPIWTHPRQRQRWGDHQAHPHKNWGDVFFDLFYVAAAYNLGNVLREDPTTRGLVYLVGCFLPIIMLWNLKMYFDARFYVGEDVFHRLYEVAVLVALGSAVLQIRPIEDMADLSQNRHMFIYCLSILCGMILDMGRYLEVILCCWTGRYDSLYPESSRVSWNYMIMQFGPAAFVIAAAVYSALQYNPLPAPSYYNDESSSNHFGDNTYSEGGGGYDDAQHDDHHRGLAGGDEYATTPVAGDDIPVYLLLAAYGVWFLVLLFWILVSSGMGQRDDSSSPRTVPMNIGFCIHRFGEWTMLMMGESILSLLIVPIPEDMALHDYYKTFLCGIITTTLLQYLHFRSQPHDPDSHAYRRDKRAAIGFIFLFHVYSISLLILGASYKMFLYEFVYTAGQDRVRRMLATASPLVARLLAGGESAALRFKTDDRQQREAHFFSGSLAAVWTCLDLMSMAHIGINANMERVRELSLMKRLGLSVLLIARVALIGFIASLSQYVSQPQVLAFVGLVGMLAQLSIRAGGTFVFPYDESEADMAAVERQIHYASAGMRDESMSKKLESSEYLRRSETERKD